MAVAHPVFWKQVDAHKAPCLGVYFHIIKTPGHPLVCLCRRFFEDYKKNENKEVQVDDIFGSEAAIRVIKDAMEMYKDEYLPRRQR
jgi:hypothetical protein